LALSVKGDGELTLRYLGVIFVVVIGANGVLWSQNDPSFEERRNCEIACFWKVRVKFFPELFLEGDKGPCCETGGDGVSKRLGKAMVTSHQKI